MKHRKLIALVAALILTVPAVNAAPSPVIARVGTSVTAQDQSITVTLTDKKQNYSAAQSLAQYRDTAILSPKSANIHPDGSKFYVNSLEGCQTVVYDMKTNARLKVIPHRFGPDHYNLWAPDSTLFHFRHYRNRDTRRFSGKPVESAFSHGGRYLWVPYYRRTFDINAQEPSAIAVIDTRSDSIVRLIVTGPLPKMIACSNNGKTMAVTHWGNNTVGLIDVSGPRPEQWRYLANVPTPNELSLNFSLTHAVNRDANSGLLLRGTVFMPGDRYLLVGSMAGGGIQVIDVAARKCIGNITGSQSPRHIVIRQPYLYLSSNSSGVVQRCPLDSISSAIARLNSGHRSASARGWQTCRVGGGARTLELSPSGKYAFVACNTASLLCVVRTADMSQLAQIRCDSYPVGLAISADGTKVIVTSQAKPGGGGNAVNIYTVKYATPEPVLHPAGTDDAPTDSLLSITPGVKPTQAAVPALTFVSERPWLVPVAVAILIAIAAIFILKRKRK